MTSDAIEIVSVNISEQKGTVKHPVPQITIDERGIVGDAHAGMPNRLVSLLSQESIEAFSAQLGRTLAPGEFAENVTTRNLDDGNVSLLDRFSIKDVELEVTQIGKECHGVGCAIFREVGRCVMPKQGIFCRVTHGGTVKAGDAMVHAPKRFRFSVITVSDRASRGQYEDLSGPRVRKLVEAFLADKRWRAGCDTTIIPDDQNAIRAELRKARDANTDVVVLTGGTGVGPRDITPDVVTGECDKLIPGIMEHIRVKYGREKPAALLSRSVAGVIGKTLVYSLPGSVKAVEEYMSEILRSLEHLILMIHAVDAH
ncbi:MAG: molybdopterin-binding protein [Phycisphaerae bacterium]|jgi:molybdenum cofactor synthesis domain-containing protein